MENTKQTQTKSLEWHQPKLEVLSLDETQQTTTYYYTSQPQNDDGAFGS